MDDTIQAKENDILKIIQNREEEGSDVLNVVNNILKDVRKNGDKSLNYYTKLFKNSTESAFYSLENWDMLYNKTNIFSSNLFCA